MARTASKKKRIIIIAVVFAVIAALVLACALYLVDYYPAQLGAIEAMAPMERITVQKTEDNAIVYAPQDAEAGLVFYPGGKVEYTAYVPLMRALAKEGVLCVLVEMPFNLAVFDIAAADGIQEQYPEIDRWYIGGHSLGGSMAASYLADHAEDYSGLILLGSYSATDLSREELSVLSIYGSEDRVMNREKYQESRANLPSDFTEAIIEGGCHAYFGMYGAQDGDGIPKVTNQEQIRITADKIAAFVEQ